MKVRIESGGQPWNTHVYDADGNEIAGIMQISVLPISWGKAVQAEITFVADLALWSDAVLSLQSLEASAAYHGYRLVPLEDDGDAADQPGPAA